MIALVLGVTTGCERDQIQAEPPPDLNEAPVTDLPLLEAAAPAAIAATDNVKLEPEPPKACPEEMVLVEGEYCPKVRHRCKDYMDPKGRYEYFRCTEYGEPKCLADRVSKRFCIDRDEYTPEGESLPANFKSWTHAEETCEGLGKRVCFESEWNFACEGEEMRPYPYGFTRDATACNADHTQITTAEGTLKDMRAPADAYPRCVSPFGVRNMSGNLEEFTTIDGSRPEAPAMKGAYWQPGRNHCRAAQTAHDRYYNGTETGFRCCKEAN